MKVRRNLAMKTVDTRDQKRYNPLIPALEAILLSPKDSSLELIFNNLGSAKDIKEYLMEKEIGFREIYDRDIIILQFKV